MRDSPIGVFDSGVGGLTVVKELIKKVPNEDIIYFGDTARVPYGTKSPSTVKRFSVENTLFLLKFNVKLLVVACNTSSAIGLPLLQKFFSIPIIGVIKPGAKAAIRSTRNGRVGVIATHTTISSGAYEKEVRHLNSDIKVFGQSCPLFVPLAEEGWVDGEVAKITADKYLTSLKEKKVDTLILGCTHYPLLRPVIQNIMGRSVKLVDSAEETAKEAEDLLEECGLKSDNKKKGNLKFYVSDEPDKFSSLGKKFLGRDVDSVEKVKDV